MTEIEIGFYNPYLQNPIKRNQYYKVAEFQVDKYIIQVKKPQEGFSTQYLLLDSENYNAYVGYLTYNSCEVTTLYIWPEYRERGLAKFLLSITPKRVSKMGPAISQI